MSATLPFTSEQFFDVFGAYNEAVWPLQIVAYLLGFVVAALSFWQGAISNRVIAGILAGLWIWTGVVYHGYFFAAINAAAYLFGAAFAVQGAIFLDLGVVQRNLRFGFTPGARAVAGFVLILYATIAYPLTGLVAGHSYPRMPWFGIAPCPLAIFTFGLLLALKQACPWWVVAIPILWSIVGGTAAFLLEVPQDWALPVSAAATLALLVGIRLPLLR
jgi:hypothetical protein